MVISLVMKPILRIWSILFSGTSDSVKFPSKSVIAHFDVLFLRTSVAPTTGIPPISLIVPFTENNFCIKLLITPSL